MNVKRNTISGDIENIEKRVPDEVDAMFEKKKAEMMKPNYKKKLKGNKEDVNCLVSLDKIFLRICRT